MFEALKQKILETGEEQIVVLADSNESPEVSEELKRLGAAVLQKKLDAADYLLSDRVAVERKTVADFLQSIVDGRLFAQLTLISKLYEKPLLVIEGGENMFMMRAIHPNAIRGALASIAIDYGVPILWTSDPKETAAQLFVIARREQIEENREVAIRHKPRVSDTAANQEFLVAGLPSVSTVLARRLLRHFKTPAKVFAAGELELKKVGGIGKEKARRILEVLNKKYARHEDEHNANEHRED